MTNEKELRLLIADDSAMVRKTLSELLEDVKNVQVVGESANAKETLEKIETLHPEWLILDLRMGEDSGFDLLKVFREKKSHLKVIMFTNHATPETRQRGLELGAHSFFDKSREFEAMIQLLEREAENRFTKTIQLIPLKQL